MFGKLAHLMYRRRWYVVGVWLVALALAVTQAAQVGKVLGPGDFTQKNSDSSIANATLETKFGQNDREQNLVLIRSLNGMSVTDPTFRRVVGAVIQRVRQDRPLHVVQVLSPADVATDRHSLTVLFISRFPGNPSDTSIESMMEDQIDRLRSMVHGAAAATPGFAASVMGTAAANHDYAIASKNDLSKGESITVPILLIILLLVFGSLVAASLPLILAGCSIILSLALVYAFGHVLDTSIYVTNVVTILGLGIAIDYSLFIVYRFREELEAWGGNVEQAVVRTMETTGRAVFFSGLTVAIGLSSLILTNLSFMQSMGLGGVLVPATALLVAMTLLPAVLGLLGARINRLRIPFSRYLVPRENGMWHRLAVTIMRRPILCGGLVLAVMLAIAVPATQLHFSFGSLKNAPQLESVTGYEYLAAHFKTRTDPVQVVVRAPAGATLQSRTAGLQAMARTLCQDPAVLNVAGPTGFVASGACDAPQHALSRGRYLTPDSRYAYYSVVSLPEVGTKQAEDLVKRVRAALAPFRTGALQGSEIHVGGAEAGYTDFNDAMYSKFPLIVVIVLALTYVFLFVAFRSVFLPLKAVLLNLLSVGAAYGLTVLVFQGGVGSSLLGFAPESGVASWVPIFLFAFLFGLSMDYEVFLLSRIRERWLSTGQNRESVAFGLEKTGRLITSAAAIMIVAFAGFLIGQEIQLKEFGFGMLASIAVDASLVRLILVPSIMELMGRWNWWVPGFLRGFARGGAVGEGAAGPRVEEEELVGV
ncbi:MAG: MMPL family transporter [Chloroflexi bacterium]|nr:MMPL family transporter [Chloroflexota bacterium]